MAHIFKADGLITNRNELDKKEGALETADNVNIDDEGKIEPRRGFYEFGTSLNGTNDRASQLLTYKGRLFRHDDESMTLEYDSSSNNSGTFSTLSGNFSSPQETILGNEHNLKIKSTESNSNLYFTEAEGIKKISAKSAIDLTTDAGFVTPAGGVKSVDAKVKGVTSPTGFLGGLSKCAYRIVWGINDANDNLVLGTPSERVILSNPNEDIKIKGQGSLTFLSGTPGDYDSTIATPKYVLFSSNQADYYVFWDSTTDDTGPEPVDSKTIGRIGIRVNINGTTTASEIADKTASVIARDSLAGPEFTISSTNGVVLFEVNDEDAGDVLGLEISTTIPDTDMTSNPNVTIGLVTTASLFNGRLEFTIPQEILDLDYYNFAENYFYQIYRTQDITTSSSSDFSALDPGDEMNLVIESGLTKAQYDAGKVSNEDDVVTESFRAGGTPLYTNPLSGEGILQANDKPPIAKDLALFRDSMFYANTETPHRKQIELLSVDDMTSLSSTVVIGNKNKVREYTFVGETELTDITCDTVANTTNGGRIEINSAENEREYYIWMRKSGTSSSVDPSISEKIGIEIDIVDDITAEDVAESIRDVVIDNSDFDIYRKIEILDYSELSNGTNDTIEITNGLEQVTFVSQTGAVTPGDATFQSATSNAATATSLASQINAHDDLSVTAIASGASVYISDNPTIVITELETVDGAWTEDPLSAFVDETADAQNATVDDVSILQSLTNQADDIFYIGKTVKFNRAIIDITTAGVGAYTMVTWEYWNGAWTTLTTLTDTTDSFKTLGQVEVTFEPPSDWATTTVSTSSSQYFIRVKTGAGSRSTIPLASIIYTDLVQENHLTQHLDIVSIRNVKNGNVDTVTTDLTNAWAVANVIQGDGEDTTNNHVLMSSLVSVSQAVDETARSLVHVINSDLYSDVNAFYLSGSDDLPGIILLENRNNTNQFFIATNDVNLITEFNPELPQFYLPTAIGTNDQITIANHGFTTGDKIFASGSFTSEIDGSTDIDSGTDKITVTAHPFQDNDTIVFGGNLNGTGITEGQLYYIVNSGVNDFEISTARGGAKLDITSSSSPTRISLTIGADIVSDTPIFGPDLYAINVDTNNFKLATTKANAEANIAIDITTAATNTFGTFFHSEVESDNEVRKNRLYYSKVGQPEAVPLINYLDVGPKDEPILRVIALRDNLMVLKTDGIYLLSGPSAPNWSVRLIDSSTKIFAPETIAVLNNQIFALSSQGIVRISEVGAFVISRDIENKVLEIMNDDFDYSMTAFGVAYESERAYHLWLPTQITDTYATQCYRYNTFTRAWTRWTKEAKCGIVNPQDDVLYLGSGSRNFVDKERKTRTRKDFCDRDFSINFTSGFYSQTTIRPSTVDNVEKGDALVQTQYLTINDVNRLLVKLDLDNGVTSNYSQDFEAKAGDNLSFKMNDINARLVIDDISGTVQSRTYSSDFLTLQSEYNTLISELNDTNCSTVFKNYKTSNGTIEYETLISSVNISAVELTVPDIVPFITGTVQVYKHIVSEVTWAPQHFGDPNKMKHVRDASILFDQTNFYGATLGFSSDISPEFDNLEFIVEGVGDLGNIGLGGTYLGGYGDEAAFRTLVPREKSRCRHIRTNFIHINSRNEFAIQGISYELRPISTRAWR